MGEQQINNHSKSIKTYLEKLREETQYVNLLGIPAPRNIQIPLQDIYIKLRAIEKKKVQAHREEEESRLAQSLYKDENNSTGRDKLFSMIHELGEYLYQRAHAYQPSHSSDALDPEFVLKENDRIVLLGAPGSGKTTFIRYLAHKAGNKLGSYIPIVISLREYASKLDSSPDTTLQKFALEKECGADEKLRSALKNAINSGRVLWLVDALDEAQRHDENVGRQVYRLRGKLVLTSRPAGYRGSGLENLPHFEIMPLFLEDSDQFINNWFDQLSKQWDKNPDWVQNCVNSLKSQFEENPRIQSLTRNPLLLTFLVILSSDSDEKNLPDRRTEVYKRYAEELINSWEKEKYQALDATQKKVFALGPVKGEKAEALALMSFYYLGWYLHLTYYGGAMHEVPSKQAVIGALAEYMTMMGEDKDVGAKTLVEFWQEVGLLDSWSFKDKSYLSFRHLTFQEYAAAWGIVEAWKKNSDRAWKFLEHRLHHPKWREPILLAADMLNESDLHNLVRRLAHGVSRNEKALRRDLRLAAMIIGEGVYLDNHLKNEIITKLRPIFHKNDWQLKYKLILSTYVLLIVAFILFRPAGWIIIVLIIGMWTVLWLLSSSAYFPRIQSILWLPTRLFSYKGSQIALIEALGQTRDNNAVPFLIEALKKEDHLQENIQLAAAEALGKINPVEYFNEVLFAGLFDPFHIAPSARSDAAAVALGKINSPEALPRLIDMLKGSTRKRFMAARALCLNIAPEAEPYLIELLKDKESAGVRRCAVEALGRIGSREIKPHIIKALKEDEQSSVRIAAVKALNRIGSPEKIKPHIIEALNDSDLSVRVVAAEVLIRIDSQEIFPKLIEAITGQGASHIRKNAVIALGNIRSPTITSQLFEALKHPDGKIRQVAVETLGILSSPETVPKLIEMLTDDDQFVRAKVCESLGHIGSEDAIPHIIQTLNDTHWIVKRDAINALGKIGSPTAVQDLIQELKYEYTAVLGTRDENLWAQITSEAATALGHIGSPDAIPSLIEALKNKNGRVRFAAAEALVRLGSPKAALPKLIVPSDPDIRELSVKSMGELSYDIEDLTILLKFKKVLWWSLTDISRWVSKGATHALEQVENRILILELANQPFENILIPSPSKRPFPWPGILFWTAGALAAIFIKELYDYIKVGQGWINRDLIMIAGLLLGTAVSGLGGYFFLKKRKI